MKSTVRVQAALDALELGIRIIEFPESTATAEQAAAAVGCSLGAIVKSLLFLLDGQPTLVLVGGDRMVDQRKLAALRRAILHRGRHHRDLLSARLPGCRFEAGECPSFPLGGGRGGGIGPHDSNPERNQTAKEDDP